jgi:hypothetical protein
MWIALEWKMERVGQMVWWRRTIWETMKTWA